ncbi:HPr kinase/phosphorylase [Paracoccus sp. NGMCC 1.201697]|uniref:HPr kinase/phosphorylase n=1 Tax=Paracoccus broussonetiae subsp. drimophilus TaxID=3373869 RepID=A0ABW7LKJ6_9RHOB
MTDSDAVILHASSVEVSGRGLLILGASGSGKSSLALSLMALGGVLVADDRTRVCLQQGRLIADCPEAIRGRIEARGVGILAADYAGAVELTLAVDMGRAEPERLPPRRHLAVLGVDLPLVLGQGRGHLASVLRQYLVAGRADRDEA